MKIPNIKNKKNGSIAKFDYDFVNHECNITKCWVDIRFTITGWRVDFCIEGFVPLFDRERKILEFMKTDETFLKEWEVIEEIGNDGTNI